MSQETAIPAAVHLPDGGAYSPTRLVYASVGHKTVTTITVAKPRLHGVYPVMDAVFHTVADATRVCANWNKQQGQVYRRDGNPSSDGALQLL